MFKFAVNIFSGRLPKTCRLLPKSKLRNSRRRKMAFPFAAAGIASRSQRSLPGRDLHSLERFAFARRNWAFTGATFFRPELAAAIPTILKGLLPLPQVGLACAFLFSNFGGLCTTAVRFS